MSCLSRYSFPFTSILLALAGSQLTTKADSNVLVQVMAANTTSGSNQRYETPALNIFKGLKPDIVAIQEFNVSNTFGINTTAALSNMVATTFGTNFVYYRETGYSIPNGIISRYPLLASGSWVDSDSGVNDRGFAWARIDLPGTNEIYVVSVHLKASSGADNEARRAAEAAELKDRITTNFPANAWIVVGGDMNLYDDTEAAIVTLKTFLSDSPVPADQNGDPDTNAGRGERYDRVLMSFSMTNRFVPTIMPSRTYTNGLVFDSRVYTPLSEVTPVVSTDSGAVNMQHMAVVKHFQYTITETNAMVAPVITNQPSPSLTVTQGNNAGFVVVAGGTAPLSYQWRHYATNIAGATAASYTRVNAQPAHAGNYTVVITNAAGSITSSIATLTVLVPATFSTPPQSLTVTQGGNATFSAVAGGNPAPGYQWRLFSTNLPGATSSTLSRNNAQPADAGDYTVVITNSVGAQTSSVVTLTVLVAPTISLPPQTQIASQGDDVTFAVTAAGSTPLGYQWRFNSADLAGATATNYTRYNVQPADVGNYSVVITNAAGSVTSTPASLSLQIPSPLVSILTPHLLQWEGLSNLTYTVQSRTNLTQTNWPTLGTASSSSSTIWFTNSESTNGLRLFRVTYP